MTSISLDYAVINNGGSTSQFMATEKANLVLRTKGTITATNCTFENSNGYGVVVENGFSTIDFTNTAFNNTFTNNELGDFLDKNN